MSGLYQRGMGKLHRRAARIGGDDGELGVISTPAAQQARIQEITQQAESLAAAIATYQPTPTDQQRWAAWRTEWQRWLKSWRAFVDETDWSDRLWGETANRIESYADALGRWRAQFESDWDGEVHAPRLESETKKKSPWGSVAQGVAIGVGVSVLSAGLLALLGWRR